MESVSPSSAYLSECCHKRCDLAVVCCIHVSTCLYQQLHDIKMTPICSQPQRSVPLLITHINVSPSTGQDTRNSGMIT